MDLNQAMRPRKVCVCKSVSKEQIIDAVDSGCKSFEAVSEKTEAATGCGTCENEVNQVIQAHLAKKKAKNQGQGLLDLG